MFRRIVVLATVACFAVAPTVSAQGSSAAKEAKEEKEKHGTKHRLDALEATVEALQAALEGVDLSGLGALQTLVESLQDAVEALTIEVGSLADGLAGTQADVATAQTDISALQTGLGDTQDTVVDIQADVAALQDAIDGLGGTGPAIIWSGGCTGTGSGGTGVYIQYCADGTDAFSNAVPTHLLVSTGGTFTVQTAGLYRINYWGASEGVTGSVEIRVNGTTLQFTLGNLFFPVTQDQPASLTWKFAVGDTFGVHVYNWGGEAYSPWAPAGAQSRLQVEYLGE